MKAQLFIIALTVWGIPVALASSSETMAKQWYERRAEGSEGIYAKPGPINQAIYYYEKLWAQNPSEENSIALLRCYYFKGSFVVMSNEERKAIFEKGKTFGELMAKKFPGSAGIKYWLAAHWGKWAKAYGVLAAAREGVADRIKKLSEEVIKLDSIYNDGGGYEILGLVHLYSPYIPFLLTWPSDQKALENLQSATHLAPTIPNNLCLAMGLLKEKRKKAAEDLLRKTLAMVPRPEKLIEDRNGLRQAAELLKKI